MTTEAKERTDTQRVADVFDSLTRVRFELAAAEAASRGAEDADQSRGVTSIINRLRWQVRDARDTLIDVHDRLRENGASPPEPSGGLALSEEGVRELASLAYQAVYLAKRFEPDLSSVKQVTYELHVEIDDAVSALLLPGHPDSIPVGLGDPDRRAVEKRLSALEEVES